MHVLYSYYDSTLVVDTPNSDSYCCGQNSNSLLYVVHPCTPTVAHVLYSLFVPADYCCTHTCIACPGGFAAIRMYSYKLAPLMATPPVPSVPPEARRFLSNHCISFFRVEILAFLNLVRTSSSGHAETISLLADLQSREPWAIGRAAWW